MQVLDLKGKKVGDISLEESVFAIEPKQGPMHTYLQRQLNNARSGSASTLTRSEVRGGGRKPWRQKGTGRARAGSIRSPLWHGGGVVFGPKPRDYSISMPRKMRHVAVRSALSATKDKLVVVKDFEGLKEPKTKLFNQILKDLKVEGKKVLLILGHAGTPETLKDAVKGKMDYFKVQQAARNIDRLKVINAAQVNVKDLLDYEVVLISEASLNSLNETFKSKPEEDVIIKAPIKKGPRKEKVVAPRVKKPKAAKPKEEKVKKEKTEKAPKAEKKEETKSDKPKAKDGGKGKADPKAKKK